MQKGCPKCGRMIDDNLKICPYCNYNFEEINAFFHKKKKKKSLEGKYAGFIKRLVAGLIDIYITVIITLGIILMINKNIESSNTVLTILLGIFIYIISLSIMERTSWHASIGKKIVGIEVTDEYENPITLNVALFRNAVKILNVLTFGIGFLTCASHPKKQTLADKISNTYVLNKIDLNGEEKHDYASLSRRFLAYVIDLLIIGIISFAIIYAYDYLLKNINITPIFLVQNEKAIKKIIPIIIYIIYFPINESGRGKTPGKRYLNKRLTDNEEYKISFTKSLIRELLIIVDILTFGFLLPISHKRGQTVKDILTKTININD